MMGFGRYKSTGNVLGEKFAFYKRTADNEEEDDCSFIANDSGKIHDTESRQRKKLSDRDYRFFTDQKTLDPDELSTRRSLLERYRQHKNYQSDLLLIDNIITSDNNRRISYAKYSEVYKPLECESDELALNGQWKRRDQKEEWVKQKHSKSIGDFLAIISGPSQPPVVSSECNESNSEPIRCPGISFEMNAVSDQQQQQQDQGQRKPEVGLQEISGEESVLRLVIKADHSLAAAVRQQDSYARLVEFPQTLPGGRQVAKTAVRLRTRKVGGSLRSTSLSSSSLSSLLAHKVREVSPLDSSRPRCNQTTVSVSDGRTVKLMLDNDAQLLKPPQVSEDDGLVRESLTSRQGHTKLAEKDNGNRKLAAAHSDAGFSTLRQTKASCGRQLHCFVDVGYLQQQQQQQRHPVTCGRSSYYNSNDSEPTAITTDRNNFERQGNKLDAHDNGIDSANLSSALPDSSCLNTLTASGWRLRQRLRSVSCRPTLAAKSWRNTAPTTEIMSSVEQSTTSSMQQQQQQQLQLQQQLANAFHYAPKHEQNSSTTSTDRLELETDQDNRPEPVNVELASDEGAVEGGLQPRLQNQGELVIASSRNSLTNRNITAELNNVASKFMSSCSVQTWRQALQPSKSGSYQVARKQQVVAISGSKELAETSNEISTINDMSMFSSVANANQQLQETVATCSEGINLARNVRRSARYSRPGRSPISLQRQTNARLARHRLRIQQQRQEQLSQLALREREQFKHHKKRKAAYACPSKNRLHDNTELIPELFQYQRQSFSRTADTKVPFQTNISINTPLDNNLERQPTKTQQKVILSAPNTSRPSATIEICDSQLACSSRQLSQPATTSHRSYSSGNSNQRTNNQDSSTSSAINVTAYKSINMLEDAANISRLSNYYRQSEKDDRESITPDDTQTIASSSGSSLSLSYPFCKICHIGSGKVGDKLISPCRCSGTMQYIHCGCLLKWLEISNRSNEKPMSCELCAHEYSWHKKFNYKRMRLPKCSIKDVFLHLIFVAALGVMLFSAISPMLHKSSSLQTATKADSSTSNYKNPSEPDQSITRHRKPLPSASYHHPFNGHPNHLVSGQLAQDEKYILICAASFFISFFLAIYVQTKARDTLCSLIAKFLSMNQTYYITEYDHGHLNSMNNSNDSKQQQQQQQQANSNETSRVDRKNTAQKS